MFITGGTVLLGRTQKTADYEGNKADITLSFGFEGADIAEAVKAVDTVSELVLSRVRSLVRRIHLDEAPKTAVADAPLVNPAPANPRGRGRPPKVSQPDPTTPKDEAATADLFADEGQVNPTPTPVTVDGLSMPVIVDDLFTAQPENAAPGMTDADLVAHVAKVNEMIQNPKAIRGLIATFVPGGVGAVSAIPPAKRAEFVAALKTLPKA